MEPNNAIYREPQSIENLPNAIINTKLPRTSKGIKENKEFVKMKIAQMMPEDQALPMISAINSDEEYYDEVFQLLIKQYPAAFVKDEYNRWNGKISDPMMQARYTKDTFQRTDLTNAQKVEKIQLLNTNGETND